MYSKKYYITFRTKRLNVYYAVLAVNAFRRLTHRSESIRETKGDIKEQKV